MLKQKSLELFLGAVKDVEIVKKETENTKDYKGDFLLPVHRINEFRFLHYNRCCHCYHLYQRESILHRIFSNLKFKLAMEGNEMLSMSYIAMELKEIITIFSTEYSEIVLRVLPHRSHLISFCGKSQENYLMHLLDSSVKLDHQN